MKNVLRAIVVLALIAAALWLWRILFPSPEKVITDRLEKLAAAASVHAGQGYLPRLAGAQRVGNSCASNVDISIDLPRHREHTTRTRDEIVQGLMAINTTSGLAIKFHDITVTVSADQTTAQADLTVEVQVGGEPDVIVQQMKFTLQKIDGQWLITKVQTVRPLSWANPAPEKITVTQRYLPLPESAFAPLPPPRSMRSFVAVSFFPF